MTDGQYGLQCKWEGHDIVPAVRRAVVAAIRKQASDERKKGDKFTGSESLELMADPLERRGDE